MNGENHTNMMTQEELKELETDDLAEAAINAGDERTRRAALNELVGRERDEAYMHGRDEALKGRENQP